MSEKEEQTHQEDVDEQGPDYKVSKKVAINDLLSMDKEDESLRKYKEALLGQASKEAFAPKDDPRRVVITELRVTCEGRPGGDIIYNLETKESLEKLKDQPFTLMEGCNYKISVTFRVQHEIVSGLKYSNVVSRLALKARDETMIGSFAPQKDTYKVTFPRNGWETAPKGMVSRGKYKAKTQFIDDDKQVHLEYEYASEI